MAASAEEHDIVPIFGLPDELLIEIFSYITFIPEKMALERVSKRIQYVSSRSQSWKGIHKLVLRFRGPPRYADRIFLNSICVPFVKWPAAIQLLLERTHINELRFDCGIHYDTNELDQTVFPSIMEVFNKNILNKLKLKIITCRSESHVNQLYSILIHLLKMSVLYLERFVLFIYRIDDVGTNSLTELWPIISKCNSLKSFSFDCTELSVDWTALIGKPLTQLGVYGARSVPGDNDLDNLIEVINNAKGEGVKTLYSNGIDVVPQNIPTPFKYFCDNLNENSRKKLTKITGYRVKTDEINRLYLVPSIFPNLEHIEIKKNDWTAIDIDHFCTMAISFLNLGYLAHSQSSNCRMLFESLTVEGNGMQLKENLEIACQNDGITVGFFDDWPAVYLSKGNVSFIQINSFDEIEEIDDEDDENFE